MFWKYVTINLIYIAQLLITMKNKNSMVVRKKLNHRIIEKIKQRLWLTISIVILIILIISAILFFLGIRINFLINDELRIDLTPLDKSILLHYNESTVLNFTITTKNFMFCKAYCEYKLNDLSKNKIMPESNKITGKITSANEKTVLNYDLTADLPGSGQILYSFEAKCNNIRSFLCSTDETPRFKTSFITFNYDLTEQEKVYKKTLREVLINYTKELENIDLLSQQTNLLLFTNLMKPFLKPDEPNNTGSLQGIMPSEIKDLAPMSYELDSQLAALQTQASQFIEEWQNEHYTKLTSEFSANEIEKYKKDLDLQRNKILELIDAHNSLAAEVMQELNTLKELNEMHAYYQQINSTDKLQALNVYFKLLNLMYGEFTNRNFKNYGHIKESLNSTNSLFLKLKLAHAADKEQEKLLGIENIRKLLWQINYLEDYTNIKNITNNTDNEKAANLTTFDFNKTIELCAEIPVFIEQLKLLENKTTHIISNITYYVADSTEYLTNVSFNQTILNAEIYLTTFCKKGEFKIEINDTLEIAKQELFLINNLTPENLLPSISFTLSKNEPKCCIFGECKTCCTFETCADDARTYPAVFLHGHSFNKKASPESSIAAFTGMHKKLQEEGIINAGEITLASSKDETAFGEYGKSGLPVSFRATYYYIGYFDLGRYQISTQKSEKIENYALRLRELIELVKYRTGAKKVSIIAHSMGGLVAREYIALFGDSEINKLILIAAPNKGIRGKVQSYCSFLGAEKECEDMAADSIFLKRLNDKNTDKKIENLFTISGTGCKMDSGEGDGIVYLDDSKLKGAKNFVIEGNCNNALQTNLHNDLLDSVLYPKVYDIVKQVLKE